MLSVAELSETALVFLDKGCPALRAILLVSLLMWMLIIERYWYIYCTYPLVFKQIKTIGFITNNSKTIKRHLTRTRQ